MRRALILLVLATAPGCELFGIEDEPWHLIFVAPQDGESLDAGSSVDVILAAQSQSADVTTLTSSRLQVGRGGAAAPLIGQVDGGTALFPAVSLPAGDVVLTGSATDDDRSTLTTSITVHVR